MKTTVKKYLLLVLALIVVIAAFSGCGTTPVTTQTTATTTGETTTAGPTTISTEEQLTFSIWLYATPNDYYSTYSENPIVQYLNKKFNVILEFQQPAAGTEQEALSLMMGSGQYTDMIETSYYTGSINSLYQEGVIMDLKDQVQSSMPNLMNLINSDPTFKRNIYNDDGQLLKLLTLSKNDQMAWGGLVYRKDILATMTGGNIAFPSGKDVPTTIADWEYMLPLYKTYFEASGMAEYAPLIIPAVGYFATGELVSGFGVSPSFDVKNGQVEFGPTQPGFYNYLKKMKEWYDAGYIYKDFASRTNDLFYLPNTSLTYGAAAGIWFGLSSQLGDVMSMPQYNLMVDVQAMPSPLDTANNITEAPYRNSFSRYPTTGYVVTTKTKHVERLLQALDFLYAEENASMSGIGLTAEQVAEINNQLYIKNGLEAGAYSVDAGGKILRNALLLTGGALASNAEPFMNNRLPGYRNDKADNDNIDEDIANGDKIWKTYDDSKNMNLFMTRTAAEDAVFTEKWPAINDYLNTMVPGFITGSQPLDDTSWAAFVAQLQAYGCDELTQISQATYDRYQSR